MLKKYYSIIIPAYNAEKKISKTIKSVLKQEKNLYECIIVDGNSTDNTLEIIKNYEKRYPEKIKYISEPDQGLYDGMNKGIELATGEYLYFIGAGDKLKKDVLQNVKSFLNFELEIIYGNIFHDRYDYVLGGEYNKEKICFEPMRHQSIFFHKSVFKRIGKYILKYKVAADWEFEIRCMGEENINKEYINLTIANFEGNGYSTKIVDNKFQQDKEKIISNHLGKKYADLYKSAKCKVWLNSNFKNLIKKRNNINVSIFGAGGFGREVNEYLKFINQKQKKNINVKFYLDNNKNKWEKKIDGLEVLRPDKKNINLVDLIIIASMPGKVKMKKQLQDMGIDDEKIVSAVE